MNYYFHPSFSWLKILNSHLTFLPLLMYCHMSSDPQERILNRWFYFRTFEDLMAFLTVNKGKNFVRSHGKDTPK